MMPGATDAVSDDEPLGQGTVIMAAMRIDRENLAFRTHQQDILVTDMPQQGLAGEIVCGNAEGEIGSGRCRLVLSHVLSLLRCTTGGRNHAQPLDGPRAE